MISLRDKQACVTFEIYTSLHQTENKSLKIQIKPKISQTFKLS
jgi:hypothetical protein